MSLTTLTTLPELRRAVASLRSSGRTVGFVPTMGALHAGHLSLVQAATDAGHAVVVSIFVNPTQFAPTEDLARYPRPFAADQAVLTQAGAALLWAPGVEIMYPAGFQTQIRLAEITQPLEGAFRPGHFEGVATVVAKLLGQVQPDQAFFGEKDWQQLQVVRQMARDLDLATQIVGVPIARDEHGLALSSRNQYLDEAALGIARQINRILHTVVTRAQAAPGDVAAALEEGRRALRAAGLASLDYLALTDPANLQPLERLDREGRLLFAGQVGTTRLIDNMAVPPARPGL